MIPLLAIIIFMMNFFSSLQTWEGLNDSMLMGIDIFSDCQKVLVKDDSTRLQVFPAQPPRSSGRCPKGGGAVRSYKSKMR